MDTDQLQLFSDVFRARSFADVARVRNVSPSTVSRGIGSLECELGVRLFHRTTRNLMPTEDAQRFHARVSGVADELDAAVAELRDGAGRVAGAVRLSVSTSFGQAVLLPALPALMAAYPELTLYIDMSDRRVDLVEDRIDIAVRHGRLADSSLIARKLRDVRYRLVAAPDYLAAHGTPQTPADLAAHDLLTFTYPAFRDSWTFRRDAKVETLPIAPRLTLSTALALHGAARAGLGIAVLPDWMPEVRSGLVEVLAPYGFAGDSFDSALWLLTPTRKFLPRRTRAVMDALLRL